jgi:hypothetical protein
MSRTVNKVLHGIVHGKFIEVTEDLGSSDGRLAELILTAGPSPGPEEFAQEFEYAYEHEHE